MTHEEHPWHKLHNNPFTKETMELGQGYFQPYCKSCEMFFHWKEVDGEEDGVLTGMIYNGAGNEFTDYKIPNETISKLEKGEVPHLLCPKCGEVLSSFMHGE